MREVPPRQLTKLRSRRTPPLLLLLLRPHLRRQRLLRLRGGRCLPRHQSRNPRRIRRSNSLAYQIKKDAAVGVPSFFSSSQGLVVMMLVRLALALHLFMLFLFFFEDRGCTQTSFRRQMTDV